MTDRDERSHRVNSRKTANVAVKKQQPQTISHYRAYSGVFELFTRRRFRGQTFVVVRPNESDV